MRINVPSGLTQFGLLLYLLTIPLGPRLPVLIRESLIGIMLIGLVWLTVRDRLRGERSHPLRYIVPVALFLLSSVLSLVFSTDPTFSLRASRFLPIALLVFLAVQRLAVDRAFVRRLCMVAWLIILTLSADGLYQYFAGSSLLTGARLLDGRVTAGTNHPNDLAMIPMLLPIALALLAAGVPTALRVLVWLTIPLAVLTLIVSASRHSWLGLLACFVAAAALTPRRRLMLIMLGVALLAGVGAYLLDLGALRDRLASFGRVGEDTRIGMWLVAWAMFEDAPLLGQGLFTYGELYLPYLSRVEFPPGYQPAVGYIPWAHNVCLEMLCERGVIGLAAFVTIIVAMVRSLRRGWVRVTDPVLRGYGIALVASLTAFLAMGVLDLTFLKDWVTLLFWMLAALIAVYPDLIEANETDPSASPPGRAPSPAPTTG